MQQKLLIYKQINLDRLSSSTWIFNKLVSLVHVHTFWHLHWLSYWCIDYCNNLQIATFKMTALIIHSILMMLLIAVLVEEPHLFQWTLLEHVMLVNQVSRVYCRITALIISYQEGYVTRGTLHVGRKVSQSFISCYSTDHDIDVVTHL